MWIGMLWAGLRGAMWITHVGGKFRPWPARKVTEKTLHALFAFAAIVSPKRILALI